MFTLLPDKKNTSASNKNPSYRSSKPRKPWNQGFRCCKNGHVTVCDVLSFLTGEDDTAQSGTAWYNTGRHGTTREDMGRNKKLISLLMTEKKIRMGLGGKRRPDNFFGWDRTGKWKRIIFLLVGAGTQDRNTFLDRTGQWQGSVILLACS